MLCCVDSGFCYIPQKSINYFILVGFKKNQSTSVLVCSSSQYSYFILHVLMDPSTTWAVYTWNLGIFLSDSPFFGFPLLLSLWRFQTLASSPSAQKEWVSTGVRGVTSSSNCDLFLGEKPQKQETSSTPFPPSESQPPSGICLPPFIL